MTSGTRTIWVNALNGERVRTSPDDELRFTVDAKAIGNSGFDAQEFERLLDAAEASLTATKNVIATPSVVDPSSLANAIWQKIWVHTGKSPEKCLYNVVELFVFKFLTDLGVLKPHAGFWSVAKLTETGSPADALTHYAQIGRKAVQKLFPPGDDGTTIINGTIFVNEAGAPNIAQAELFAKIVRDLASYDADVGSFRYIKREFKTRLYESFLRQSAGVKALGQYFTPRNVVQAMVRMTRPVNRGARICDPFCGVGGFLLELAIENDDLFQEFVPKKGGLKPQITLVGYDKGTDEQEDERTIILAKANMLIYFSDLLAERHSPDDLKAFCEHGLNSVFRLLRTNLGTFDRTEDEPYDLILTNPPYVTKGSKSLQETLAKCDRTSRFYDLGLKGTEGLALNWIIKKLRPRGEALVIVPDTVLRRGATLRKIEEHCQVLGVIALPNRTFYATPRQTYILALEKKADDARKQQHPVFAYIVREVGETRDAKRIKIADNDLDEMVTLFRQFRAAPGGFTPQSAHCKVVPFDTVAKLNDWRVDRRWWTYEERVELGLEMPRRAVDYETFVTEIDELGAELRELAGRYRVEEAATATRTRTVKLGNPSLFKYITTVTGWDEEQIQKRAVDSADAAPVYRAAAKAVGYALPDHKKLIPASTTDPLISFAANGDGSAGTNFVFHDRPFFVTGDRTVIRVTDPDIEPGYVLYALRNMKREHGFDHTHKAVPQNLTGAAFKIPVTETGEWDLYAQRQIARRHERILEYVKMLGNRMRTAASCDVKTD